MSWIESHQELARHPKTKRLARILHEPEVAVIGRLHCLWWWALDYADGGDLSRMDPSDIADACQWEADADRFIAAMVQVGFLDQATDGLRIHDWDEYAGRLVEKRRQNVERVKRWRAGNENLTNGTVTHNEHAYVTHNESVSYTATVPDPTVPNSTGPEEVPFSAENGRAAPAATPPKAVPTPNRTQQVIDLLAAEGVDVHPRPQDGKAIKNSGAKPDAIVAVYLAIFRHEFGDKFMWDNLSLQSAIGHLDGYRAMLAKAQASPRPGGVQGQCPACGTWKPKGEPCGRCARNVAALGTDPRRNVEATLRAVSRRS